MPVPLNWFGVATFALLGALVNPGLWLIGAGLEGLYLWALSRNERFRAVVDAGNGRNDWHSRYDSLTVNLDEDSRRRQESIEFQAGEIIDLLSRTGATDSQKSDVRQMAWLHLKLLAARASFVEVVAVAERERRKLEEQERSCRERLSSATADDELRRSLEQQLEVIKSRHSAHADAKRRLEIVDAELGRLRQQISLVREQALLATDENTIAHSLDALSASLNEANRWLKDQRELFAGIENFTDEPPPADLLASKRAQKRASKISE
jgi:hypothetical protein